jgi:hypothetical protein
MKKLLLFIPILCLMIKLHAQDKKPQFIRNLNLELPDVKKTIRSVQGYVSLYTKNYSNHSEEHDVNSIILDIEKYIDSMPKKRTAGDQLLLKEFNPLRHFFLTTTNKTTVATMFLYSGTPYQFCSYNDTATILYIYAIKDGSTYNLSKTTEKKVIKTSLENCLLPSLKAMDEFKDNEIKYIALSVYFGCKDTREGAAAGVVIPYCLTLIARTADLQQYAAGLITTKGLLANSEFYLSDEDNSNELIRMQLNAE